MRTYDFLSEADFSSLPSDRGARFLMLWEIGNREFEREVSFLNSTDDISSTRRAFIGQLNAVAETLGLGSLKIPAPGAVTPYEWNAFRTSVVEMQTKLRLGSIAAASSGAVVIGRITKARISQEIDILRHLITASALAEKKKGRLLTKLDDLDAELSRPSLSFAQVAAVAAAVATVFAGSATALANGPKAVESIVSILHWVGQEKDAEEDEQEDQDQKQKQEQPKLMSPPKALAAPNDFPKPAADNGD